MHHFMIIRPATGETMGETKQGLVVLPAAGVEPTADQAWLAAVSPKLLASMHVAENHQSAMNCRHGGGWEVATIDLLKGVVAVTETLSID